MTKPYDRIWRKNMPMTFRAIYREAVETCSPDLYNRRLASEIYLQGAHWYGMLEEFGIEFSNNRGNDYRYAVRLVQHAFVRAYLHERRAGLQPRTPGPTTDSNTVIAEAHASMERLRNARDVKLRQASERDAAQVRVGTLSAAAAEIVSYVERSADLEAPPPAPGPQREFFLLMRALKAALPT